MIFFTSDLHLSHNREFLYEPRGYSSVQEMNDAILKNWNSVITNEDDVYILGDLMLSDNDSAMEILKQLNGKLHIIRGNHDTEKRLELYKSLHNVVEIQEAKYFKYDKYHFFLCHYPTLSANWVDEKPLRAKCINLCGHTHTKNKFSDMDKGVIYHVDMDAHNCYPVRIDKIIDDIEEEFEHRKGDTQ